MIDFFLMRARRNKHRSCSSSRRRTLPVSNYWVCSCVSFPLNMKFISELHQCLLLLLMSKVIVSLSSNSLAYGVWLPSMQILCKVMDGPMFRSRQMIVSDRIWATFTNTHLNVSLIRITRRCGSTYLTST